MLLVVFSGTSPLAEVDSSSSVANLNCVDSGWTEMEEIEKAELKRVG